MKHEAIQLCLKIASPAAPSRHIQTHFAKNYWYGHYGVDHLHQFAIHQFDIPAPAVWHSPVLTRLRFLLVNAWLWLTASLA